MNSKLFSTAVLISDNDWITEYGPVIHSRTITNCSTDCRRRWVLTNLIRFTANRIDNSHEFLDCGDNITSVAVETINLFVASKVNKYQFVIGDRLEQLRTLQLLSSTARLAFGFEIVSNLICLLRNTNLHVNHQKHFIFELNLIDVSSYHYCLLCFSKTTFQISTSYFEATNWRTTHMESDVF